MLLLRPLLLLLWLILVVVSKSPIRNAFALKTLLHALGFWYMLPLQALVTLLLLFHVPFVLYDVVPFDDLDSHDIFFECSLLHDEETSAAAVLAQDVSVVAALAVVAAVVALGPSALRRKKRSQNLVGLLQGATRVEELVSLAVPNTRRLFVVRLWTCAALGGVRGAGDDCDDDCGDDYDDCDDCDDLHQDGDDDCDDYDGAW